ncbi:amidohydrolase family protein [bacterium]|nr:amidohydrolase family protein [bacterium]
MQFIDANCCIGKLSVPLPGYIDNAKELAKVMKQAGIDGALVYHISSKEYSPTYGNNWILDEVADYGNLYPCWAVMPHHTGEMPPPVEIVESMLENGVRTVRVFPKTHNWSLSEWSCGTLLSVLQERSIPLFIDYNETSVDQIYGLCKQHTGLAVVLTGAPFRFSRLIYALLSETSNLYLDTSMFQLHGGIEDVCAKFSARRLLFGTSIPLFNPEPSVMAVQYAGISDEEKSMIAGGNLLKLLGVS